MGYRLVVTKRKEPGVGSGNYTRKQTTAETSEKARQKLNKGRAEAKVVKTEKTLKVGEKTRLEVARMTEEHADDGVVVEPEAKGKAEEKPGTPEPDTYQCLKCGQSVTKGTPMCACGCRLNWKGIA